MGHSRRSEYDLWLEKKHGVETFQGNDATEYGNVVERGVAEWAADQLDVAIRRNVFRADPHYPFHVNLDAKILDRAEAIEVKSTGYKVDELWGEPGTDDVPHPVVCQCQWQMAIAGLERVHVAAALSPSWGGNKLRLYEVEALEPLQTRMIDIGAGWWDRYIIGDDVPSDLPSEDAIRAIERVPNFEVAVDRDLVAELLQAKGEARDANAAVKELTKQLHKALYDPETEDWAEIGRFGEGEKDVVKYFQYSRKAYEVKAKDNCRRLQLPKEM